MRKTIISSGSVLCAFVFCLGLILTGCAKINDALEEHANRLDNLEGVQIKSLKEQITAINGSIEGLKSVDAQLNDYIESLQSTAADLQTQIDAANDALSDLETDLESQISASEQKVLNELNTVKTTLEAQLATINNTITTLQAKDEELEQKIADLKTYVDGEISTTEDWAESTFSTLEQYEATQTAISEINALIMSTQESITALEDKLSKKITDDIAAAVAGVNEGVAAKVTEITNAYTAAIATAKDEITAAYTDAIKTDIATSEASMKSWVNEVLAEGYYDIATTEGKLTSLENELLASDNILAEQIIAQQTALDQAKTELTEAYKAAIDEAINTNNGVIRGEIEATIKEAQDALQLQITSITSEITTIKEELNSIKNKLDELLSRIQSVVYMPEYSDGSAPVDFATKEVELSFKISPSSVVSSLESVWESALSIKYLTTELTKDAPVMHDLSIKSAEFDTTIGIITLVLDCSSLEESFYQGTTSASAALFISDGKNNISSDFIPLNPSHIVDLSSSGTANSYIVSESGAYKFKTVKGNSIESVGIVDKPDVLWETFGTSTVPSVGDLVKNVTYSDGYIAFEATDKKGNAVIAAKDASGKILWSWHIWLTDQPQGHVYYNNAGTMMDRNLGATSATPGDVGALGLLYQWGRKDPFLGSSSISSKTLAKSTLSWPSRVSSTSSTGTIAYVTANPTTFLAYNSNNYDWYYSDVEDVTDNTRWQTEKTVYDPCPPGWRVPDGRSSGVWATALGSSSSFSYAYNSSNEGMNFSGKFGSASTIWYPASGYRYGYGGGLGGVGYGLYWSVTPSIINAFDLYFNYDGVVDLSGNSNRAYGYAVRCLKEGTGGGSSESEIVAKDLSISGTANSYIVSESGAYKFRSTKGNSTTSVGTVDKAEVLWETFGTDTAPSIGDLVKNVTYSDGYITFEATDKKGNAVIAAKDATGKILWSWHIWLTDQPEGQVYYNNAGTMMDRNLGATSATPGDVGALGLLYQWGRKDPFLGSSSISESTVAASTLTWPSAVGSNSERGTIDYVTANPTTFVTDNSNNCDWYYSDVNNETDNTRWQSVKTIYDPCPPGWRVPDGGSSGVWATALGSSSYFTYDSTNEGMNFSGKFGSASTIWYPASGFHDNFDGGLYYVGSVGYYWSVAPIGCSAYYLGFGDSGGVGPSYYYIRAIGFAVRCLQESK